MSPVPAWIDFFLSGVCHQFPGHTLFFQGLAMPLCARCTGLFGGTLLIVVLLIVSGRWRHGGFAPWWAQGVLIALGAWWALDGINSFLFAWLGRPWLYEPTNALRLFTGLGLGLAVALELMPVAAQSVVRRPESRSVIERPVELVGLLALQGALGILLLSTGVPFVLAAGWAIAGVAVLFVTANTLLLVLITGSEPEGLMHGRLILLTAGGVLLTLVETGGLALVRWLVGV